MIYTYHAILYNDKMAWYFLILIAITKVGEQVPDIVKGVLFNGKVYDNLNPNGIKLKNWLSDLIIPYKNGSVDLWQLFRFTQILQRRIVTEMALRIQ